MKTKGWQKIFKFTFIQTIKAKSFIVSTSVICAIMMLMIIGINFIPMLMGVDSEDITGGSSSGNDYGVKITSLYVLDETGLSVTPDWSKYSEMGVTVTQIAASELDSKTAEVKASTGAVALLQASMTDSGISLLMSRPESEDTIVGGDCSTLLSYISAEYQKDVYLSLGVKQDDVKLAMTGVSTTVTVAGEAPKSMIASVISTIVPMLSSLILFIFIFAYGQMVAQAIATEKTSRVMELLLTSVRPLAVIIGKILAMCLISLSQLLIIGGVTGITMLVTAPFGFLGQLLGSSQVAAAVSSPEITMVRTELANSFASFTPLSVVLIFVIFILGFLFYALVAGLIGSSVSRMEDLTSAMQPLAILGVLGFYLAYMPSIFNMESDGGANMFVVISHYCPLSSPFSLPSAIMLGEITGVEVFISVAVLLIFDVLFAMFVAKIYEQIILHTGNRLKISDMVKLAKKS